MAVKQYLNSVVTLTGANGHTSYTYQYPTWCYGPAKYTDPATHQVSLPYWETGIADGYTSPPGTPANDSNSIWGVPDPGYPSC